MKMNLQVNLSALFFKYKLNLISFSYISGSIANFSMRFFFNILIIHCRIKISNKIFFNSLESIKPSGSMILKILWDLNLAYEFQNRYFHQMLKSERSQISLITDNWTKFHIVSVVNGFFNPISPNFAWVFNTLKLWISMRW